MRTHDASASEFLADTLDVELTPIGGDRPVVEFVSESVTTLPPTTTLRDAATALRRDDTSLAVVGDLGDVDGVISERDLVQAVALGFDLDVTTVAEIESESLKWAASTSTVDDVATEMLETYVRHILVGNDDGSLSGVVSMRDLLTAYLV